MFRALPVSFSLAVLAFATAPLHAQKWRVEEVPEAGIQIEVPSRLERMPLRLGSSRAHHRAKLRPKDTQDYVRSQWAWSCDVYEWSKKEAGADAAGIPDTIPEEAREKIRELLSKSGAATPTSFESWLEDQDSVTIKVKGKKKRGKSGRLDFEHWVWLVDNQFGPIGICYCEAAVYDFEDRQVAIVIEMPLETPRQKKPKSKWKKLIDFMIKSGAAFERELTAEEEALEKDRYADTPERIEALAKAKKNIESLRGWDYFTMPNYIVFYSWDFEKPSAQTKSKKEAEFYSERLEKMRALYLEAYPLDETGTKAVMPDPASIPSLSGPITGGAKPVDASAAKKAESEEEAGEQLGKPRFSVFRLCATYDQFRKYGNTSGGVVGWFSPASKELVVFLGGDKMMGKGATETVTYHEGWHQFADFYFDHPDTPTKQSLHRWFDEGHGDYFGGYRWGKSGWTYYGSKMRYDSCKNMVRVGDYIPFKEIVHWNRQRFYTDRPSYRYAQAFSMIDFLRRGERSRGWDPRWADALDMYRKVMLVKGDKKTASDTAFFKFSDEDWQNLEEAWKAWVKSGNFKRGK